MKISTKKINTYKDNKNINNYSNNYIEYEEKNVNINLEKNDMSFTNNNIHSNKTSEIDTNNFNSNYLENNKNSDNKTKIFNYSKDNEENKLFSESSDYILYTGFFGNNIDNKNNTKTKLFTENCNKLDKSRYYSSNNEFSLKEDNLNIETSFCYNKHEVKTNEEHKLLDNNYNNFTTSNATYYSRISGQYNKFISSEDIQLIEIEEKKKQLKELRDLNNKNMKLSFKPRNINIIKPSKLTLIKPFNIKNTNNINKSSKKNLELLNKKREFCNNNSLTKNNINKVKFAKKITTANYLNKNINNKLENIITNFNNMCCINNNKSNVILSNKQNSNNLKPSSTIKKYMHKSFSSKNLLNSNLGTLTNKSLFKSSCLLNNRTHSIRNVFNLSDAAIDINRALNKDENSITTISGLKNKSPKQNIQCFNTKSNNNTILSNRINYTQNNNTEINSNLIDIPKLYNKKIDKYSTPKWNINNNSCSLKDTIVSKSLFDNSSTNVLKKENISHLCLMDNSIKNTSISTKNNSIDTSKFNKENKNIANINTNKIFNSTYYLKNDNKKNIVSRSCSNIFTFDLALDMLNKK